jgi:HlyD family secretion protein
MDDQEKSVTGSTTESYGSSGVDNKIELAPAAADAAPTTAEDVRQAVATPPKPASGKVVTESGSGTRLGRPVRQARKARKRNNWGAWLFVVILAIAAGVGTFFWTRSTQTPITFQGQTITAGRNNPVTNTVGATGQIAAKADLSLSFGSAGTVTRVNVKQGDLVKKDSVLAEIDDSDLQTSVRSAKANLDSSQADFDRIKAGATEKELKQAEEALKQAQLRADSTRSGNALPTDIASAQANLNSARAKLEQLRSGPTPTDVANAQANLNSAKLKLDQLRGGPTSTDVVNAEANLRSAKEKLNTLLAGPDSATLSSAQAKYDQSLNSYQRQESQLKTSILNAEASVESSLNNLKKAQETYGDAYNKVRNANGSLKDGARQVDIDAETNAFRALQDAQTNYNKAEFALADAKVAYETGMRTAQSQLDDAKIQLDKVKAGPTSADIAAAEASVRNAETNLAKLTPTAADIASAEAAVKSAENNLVKLNPTAADIASAEASVRSAEANLAKLTSGGTANDIAIAESQVSSAQATYDELLKGPKPSDVAVAQAKLDTAKANYESAVIKLRNAKIVAPFDGVVVTATPIVGQVVGANAAMFQLVDTSQFRVDVSVSESDVSKIQVGQAVVINLDAIQGRSYTGKVTFVSPKASVQQNVVSYAVTVTLDEPGKNSLQEVFPNDYQKYVQELQSQAQQFLGANQGNVQRPTGGNAGGGAGRGGAAGGNAQVNAQIAQAISGLGFCGFLPNLSRNTTDPKAGMTATVTVCLQAKAGVLSVPNRALKTDTATRTRYVEVLDPATSTTSRKTVTVGSQGDSYTEITGGELKEGDLVVTSTTSSTNTNRTGQQSTGLNIPGTGGSSAPTNVQIIGPGGR